MLHKWYEKIYILVLTGLMRLWLLVSESCIFQLNSSQLFLRQLREIFVLSWPKPEDFRRFSEDFRTLPKVSEDIRRPLSTSEAI